MNRISGCAAAVALALASIAGTAAYAGPPVDRPEAIEVDRDTTPPGQAEFGFDGGAPIGLWALGLETDFLVRPVRLHTLEVSTFPVEYRETFSPGGAITLGDRAIFDVKMPLAHQTGARMQGLGDERPLDRWVPGDLQLGARLRVADRGRFSMFLRGNLTLPTGDDYDFAGSPSWTASWLGIARLTFESGIVVAATGGIRLRGTEVRIANQLVGDELAWGVGATVGIPPVLPLWCKPEQLRAAAEVVGVLGDRVGGQHSPSPVEGRIGIIGRVRPELAIVVRVGTHLDDQVGAPTFRATLDLVYQAAPQLGPVRIPRPDVERESDDGDED
jgi:hypothetical protein